MCDECEKSEQRMKIAELESQRDELAEALRAVWDCDLSEMDEDVVATVEAALKKIGKV